MQNLLSLTYLEITHILFQKVKKISKKLTHYIFWILTQDDIPILNNIFNKTLNSGQYGVTESGFIPAEMTKTRNKIHETMVLKRFDIRQWLAVSERQERKVSRMGLREGEPPWGLGAYMGPTSTCELRRMREVNYYIDDTTFKMNNKEMLHATLC